MNKKIIGGIAVIAIALAMALNVNFSAKNNSLSDISLANVEALADYEIIVGPCFCKSSDYNRSCRIDFDDGDYLYVPVAQPVCAF